MKFLNTWACLVACLFFSQNSLAEIVQDDKIITAKSSYSFKEACKYLTKRESPLIDFVSISTLNCMGEKKDIEAFCDFKEAANPYYIRALAFKKNNEVRCLSAKKVTIKYKCEKSEDKLCQDSEIGCFHLREKLAKRLSITYSSITDKKFLNCHFEIKRNFLELDI